MVHGSVRRCGEQSGHNRQEGNTMDVTDDKDVRITDKSVLQTSLGHMKNVRGHPRGLGVRHPTGIPDHDGQHAAAFMSLDLLRCRWW